MKVKLLLRAAVLDLSLFLVTYILISSIDILPLYFHFGPELAIAYLGSSWPFILSLLALFLLIALYKITAMNLGLKKLFLPRTKTKNTQLLKEAEKTLLQSRINRIGALSSVAYAGVPILAYLVSSDYANIAFSANSKVNILKLDILIICLSIGLLIAVANKVFFVISTRSLRESIGIHIVGTKKHQINTSSLNTITSIAIFIGLAFSLKLTLDYSSYITRSIITSKYSIFKGDINEEEATGLINDSFKSLLTRRLHTVRALGELIPVEEAKEFSFYARRSVQLLLVIAAIFTIIPLALFIVITRYSIFLLRRLWVKTGGILRGQKALTAKIPIVENNEIGYLVGYFNILLQVVDKILIKVSSSSSSFKDSSKTLTRSVSFIKKDLLSALYTSTHDIEDITKEQDKLSSNVSAELLKILANAQKIAERLLEQGNLVNNICAQVDLFSDIVNRVTGLTNTTKDKTTQLVDIAATGEKAVLESIDSMKDIAESFSEIEEVVSAIAKIAAQTSLLSMNAAIEAAHAGEFGSGFAVVAQEVRGLSESATEQSRIIQEEISDLLASVDRGLDFSSETSSSLNDISANIQSTNDIVSKVSIAMKEQSNGSILVVQVISDVASSAKKVKKLVSNQSKKGQAINAAMDDILNIRRNINQEMKNMISTINGVDKGIRTLDSQYAQSHDISQEIIDSATRITKSYMLKNKHRRTS